MTAPRLALILDFGGVLTSDLWSSVRACAKREGLPENALVDLLHHDPEINQLFQGLERGAVGQTAFEHALAARAGIPAGHLLWRMCSDLAPDVDMLEAVRALRSAGVRVGILSNSWGSGYFNPYVGYDLENRSDALVFSDKVGLRKPDPAIFCLMLDRLGASADTSVFVDDVLANLSPAHDLGMAVIHHTRAAETISQLQGLFGVPLAASSGA